MKKKKKYRLYLKQYFGEVDVNAGGLYSLSHVDVEIIIDGGKVFRGFVKSGGKAEFPGVVEFLNTTGSDLAVHMQLGSNNFLRIYANPVEKNDV